MSSSAYASHTDVLGTNGYLRDPGSANNTIIDTLCAVVSRLIDDECEGMFFYDDGVGTRYINGIGGPRIDTPHPFFFSSGTIDAAIKGATTLQYTPSYFAPRPPIANEAMVIDTGANREVLTPSAVGAISGGKYPLTVPATGFAHAAGSVATTIQVTIAYFENMPLTQWIQELDGDGWTPPSNFYVYPNIPRRVGAANQSTADNTSMQPWTAIDLPMIPISNTTWLPTTMIGKATIGITAHWGWPVVPDVIKDLTCRGVSLMWRKRMAGQGDSGGPTMGTAGIGDVKALLKAELKDSKYKAVYI